jgi:hypothetical protein
MAYLWIAIAIAVLISGVLLGLRWNDVRKDKSAWQSLISQGGDSRGHYDPAMVRDLPDAAQRYFNFSIIPGAPLVSAVELSMRGELGLGTTEDPKYTPMKAHQILAPPHGLVWRVRVGAISGSDGATSTSSWTKFWLMGFIPVVRVSGDADHHRSAFGRVVAEGAFWTPAMLLPGDHVRWESIDEHTARAVVTYGEFEQAVDLTVSSEGQPQQVVISRWSNENASREYRLQPFGGYLRDFRHFGGYTLPTSVEGGNHFGTDEYFPFYRAKVSDIRLLVPKP